jgi:hypothetical protein
MVKIPDSPQIQRGKSVAQIPTVRQPLNIEGAGFQATQKAITTTQSLLHQEQLKQDRIQKEQQKLAFEQAKKEQEAYDVAQINDAKNKIRRIDNEIRLDANDRGIDENFTKLGKTYKQQRNLRIQEATKNLPDYLHSKIKSFVDAQAIDLEFKVGTTFQRKQKEFTQNISYEAIRESAEQFSNATNPIELAQAQQGFEDVINSIKNSGALTPNQIDSEIKAINKERKEKELQFQKRNAVKQAINGEVILDPKTQQKDLDSYFDSISDDANYLKNKGQEIAIKTGVLPTSFKREVVNSMKMGNSQKKFDSAMTINNLITQNQALQEQFKSSHIAYSTAVAERSSLGLDPKKIIEFTDNEFSKNKSLDRDLRQSNFKDEYKRNNEDVDDRLVSLTKDIADEFGDVYEKEKGLNWFQDFFLSRDPSVPQQMTQEVIEVAEEFYINEGLDFESSIETAKKVVSKNWKVTTVGKDIDGNKTRLAKYGIESQYPRYTDEIVQQANTVTKALIKQSGGIFFDNDSENFNLIPILNSVGNEKTGYNIIYKNKDGVFESLRDENNLMYAYYPDIKKLPSYKAGEKQREVLRK